MKQKLLKTFFLDLSYFLIFIFVLMVSRSKIQQFLLNIQTYGPELNALDPGQNVLEAQNLLNQISSLSNQVYIFMFLIVPLIIFILYVSLQGYSLYLLKKEKYYLIKFSLASLPSFVFFTLLVFNPNLLLLIFGMIFTLIYSWYKISLIKLFD